MYVLGVMNGTSIDGVDYVLCKADKKTFRFKASAQTKFPPLLAKRLKLAAANNLNMREVSLLSYELGRFYANNIKALKTRKKWPIDLIGLHGQTVFHSSGKATLQIGETTFITQKLNVPVVNDFRSADIVCGGQGAPLAGVFHRFLAKQYKLDNISFQNLGGISNLTYLYGKKEISFDTGPANMLMDMYMNKYLKKTYDRSGSLAAQGLACIATVERMYQHPYFKKAAPKTCGREEFGEIYFKKFESKLVKLGHANAMATLSNFTAYSIAKAYKTLLPKLPDEIIFCGGGAKNLELLKNISYYLPEVDICTSKEFKWDPQHIEAAAFAYLAYQTYKGKMIDTRSLTGAKQKIISGKISPAL